MRDLRVRLLLLSLVGLASYGYAAMADSASKPVLQANPGWPLVVKFDCDSGGKHRSVTAADTLCEITFLANSERVDLKQIGLFFTGSALPETPVKVSIRGPDGRNVSVGTIEKQYHGVSYFSLFEPLRLEVGVACVLSVVIDSTTLATSSRAVGELKVAPLRFIGNIGDEESASVLPWIPFHFPVHLRYGAKE